MEVWRWDSYCISTKKEMNTMDNLREEITVQEAEEILYRNGYKYRIDVEFHTQVAVLQVLKDIQEAVFAKEADLLGWDKHKKGHRILNYRMEALILTLEELRAQYTTN